MKRLCGRALCFVAVALWSVAASADTFYKANLNGSQEVPTNASTATGFGRVRLDASETQIIASVYFSGLGTNTTAGHIHGPAAPGVNAGVIFNLNPPLGVTSGSVVNQSFAVTPTQVAQLKAGLWYMNIHTSGFPGGEIRGQLILDSPFVGSLSGAQEVPPNASAFVGRTWVSLNTAATQALVSIETGSFKSVTGVHIHSGRSGVNGSIICDLTSSFTIFAGAIDALCTFSPTEVTALRQGQLYLNVHTPDYPGGEIRGQLKHSWNPCDFDGDGKSDATIVRDNGVSLDWWIQLSGGGVQHYQFGASSDFNASRILCGDYDGDGKADPTIWRTGASAIMFSLLSSNSQLKATQFGTTGDDPRIVGDYDGDGRDDVAVYRPGAQSVFYSLDSATNNLRATPWGTSGDFNQTSPDYDGDGKTDVAVQRGGSPTGFWRLFSGGGYDFVAFGLGSDFTTSADFDGDGHSDQVVTRTEGSATVWYELFSLNNWTTFAGVQWGPNSGRTRASADWDGDGKTDVAVFLTSSGQWWILQSSTGSAQVIFFGATGDIAVHGFAHK